MTDSRKDFEHWLDLLDYVEMCILQDYPKDLRDKLLFTEGQFVNNELILVYHVPLESGEVSLHITGGNPYKLKGSLIIRKEDGGTPSIITASLDTTLRCIFNKVKSDANI